MSADVTEVRLYQAYCVACRWRGREVPTEDAADDDAEDHDAEYHP